jgi:hypothetical protein
LRKRSLAVLGVTALLPLASAAELSASARLSAGTGVDSNARRDYDQVPGGTQADGFVFATGGGRLQLTGDKARVWGDYELGVRKFFQLSSEDVLVQTLAAEGSLLLGPTWALGLDGRGKDRRGGDRDYTDLGAFSFLELAASRALDLRAAAGARRFIYRPVFADSFTAAEFTVQAQYRFDRKHSIGLFGEFGLRSYNGAARADPRGPPDTSVSQRQDTAFLAGVSYSYRGPVALTLGYSFGGVSSNSFGETVFRHRISVAAGVRLPWDVTLLAQGAIQLANYPDGTYQSPDLILIEDDNQSLVSLKILRPLTSHLDVDLRFALYHANVPQTDMTLTYLRQVAWIGITWRL